MLFSNESSSNEISITRLGAEIATRSIIAYLILLILSLGALLVTIPTLTLIAVVLKNRKLRRKRNNVFYLNLLVADVLAALLRWIITCAVVIGYLLDASDVNCSAAFLPIHASYFAIMLMFFLGVINQFLHVAYPFRYKSMVTAKRITWSLASLWLILVDFGVLHVSYETYLSLPEHGMCIPSDSSFPLFHGVGLGTLAVSICIITGASVYLRYKIIHFNQFCQECQANSC